ncbi:MAG: YfhO family protein [Nanoarchaeota archaeon]|mgnify:FL=1
MKKINLHIIFIGILFILSLFYLNSVLHKGVILSNIHYVNDLTFLSYNTLSALKNNELPLWTPYFYSGQPLLAIPESYMFDLNFLFIYLFRNIYAAMNLSLVLYFFLAGLGMYILTYAIIGSKKAAFISALFYMFNGFVQTFVIHGHINILEGYALIPFIFLFVYKAMKSTSWVFYSILAGIFFALQIFAGSMILFFYTALLVLAYLAVNLMSKNFKSVLIKSFFVGMILVIVCLSLASVKLLPVLEFTKLSSRGIGVSFQEFLGEPISFSNFQGVFIGDFGYAGMSGAVGIAGIILILLGLFSHKKRIVLFALLLTIFSLLFASGTFVADFMYKVPGFDKLRHVERAMVLFVFAASILAAYGFIYLSENLNKSRLYSKYSKYQNIVFALILSIILIEVLLVHTVPTSSKIVNIEDIKLIDYMSKDNSKFRVMNIGMKDIIGASGYNYYSQKGISDAKGGGGIWMNDYVIFLSVGNQYLDSNILSVLNVKYIISDKKLDFGSMKLAGRFNQCPECPIMEAWGPYLYERNNVTPRFYIAPKSALIVGDSTKAKNLVYGLILSDLNPGKIVMVEVSKIDDYSQDFLGKFDYIFLLEGSVSQESLPKLVEYQKNGGMLIPDILSGQNSVSQEDVKPIMNITANATEVEIRKYTNNKITLNLNGEKGWLVASERFAYFPGWKATVNNQEIPIYKADEVISSLYLDGQKGNLDFEYSPSSYKTGKLISIISLILVLVYIGYFIYSKKGGSNQA